MPKKEEPKEEVIEQTEVEEVIAEEIVQEAEIETPEVVDTMQELNLSEASDAINSESMAEEEVNAGEPVTIQPVKFTSFETSSPAQGEVNKNLDILMDIKLQMTVELGRTELPVKKVLELTKGSIVELEKVAGEPVELYANGKLVAQGEVVVIEDNFGLRITSITDPEDRLKGI